MKYSEFITKLNQEIDFAYSIRQQSDSAEDAVKTLLFRERSLSEKEKEAEYTKCLHLISLAENDLLKISLNGRETLDEALNGLSYSALEKTLQAQITKLLKREEAQEDDEYRLPERTLAALRRLQSLSIYDYDKHFSKEELLSLLQSVTLSNSVHDAAKNLLKVSGHDELNRRRRRLQDSFLRSIDKEERRMYIAAALLNLRRRGLLPAELEITHEEQPVLDDKTLLMMFMCADDQIKEFTRAAKPDADWIGFTCDAVEAIFLTIPAIVFPAILIIVIVEQIFPLVLTVIVAISIVAFELLMIWAIAEFIRSAIAAIKPEQSELDLQAHAFDEEMSRMARSLFDERTGRLNAVAAYVRGKESEIDEPERLAHRQHETEPIRELQ